MRMRLSLVVVVMVAAILIVVIYNLLTPDFDAYGSPQDKGALDRCSSQGNLVASVERTIKRSFFEPSKGDEWSPARWLTTTRPAQPTDAPAGQPVKLMPTLTGEIRWEVSAPLVVCGLFIDFSGDKSSELKPITTSRGRYQTAWRTQVDSFSILLYDPNPKRSAGSGVKAFN